MAHSITSSNSAHTHAIFAGVVVLDTVPKNTTTIRMICEVSSSGPRFEEYTSIIQESDGIPLTIDYHNPCKTEFPEGAVAFVHGVLSMEYAHATGASPKVLIRADQLVP